jgi:UPF0755 protein
MMRAVWALTLVAALGATLLARSCRSEGAGAAVTLTVPSGATFGEVVDTLSARGLVGARTAFSAYARLRGADRQVRSGRYEFREGAGWSRILDRLTAGTVLTEAVTFPEGWTIREMADPVGQLTGRDPDTLRTLLLSDSMAARFQVPGPGLEGYLFPDTYRFAPGVPLDRVLETMTAPWKEFWTEERLAQLQVIEMDQRQVTTIASIVQAEAGNLEEMPTIAGVYHNRVRQGWLLQADPTVLYALGGPRDRLLFAAIDSVADNPYNTYRNRGLPPGPIGAPGRAALEAALYPADVPYMYFVAGPDGGHVFSVTQAEHNRAVADYRRRRAEARRSARGEDTR